VNDAAIIKCMGFVCTTAVVVAMLIIDGDAALAASAAAIATFSGLGGYAIAKSAEKKAE